MQYARLGAETASGLVVMHSFLCVLRVSAVNVLFPVNGTPGAEPRLPGKVVVS
jgi:hypothetical protein